VRHAPSFAIAAAAAAGLAVLGVSDLPAAVGGWLASALFWSALPIGALMLRLIVALTGGARRTGVVEALDPHVRAAPAAWLLSVPLAGALLGSKSNGAAMPVLLVALLAAFLAGVTVLAWLAASRRLNQPIAAAGLVFYGLALCLVGPDLQLTLSPGWIPQGIPMAWAAWMFLAGSAAAVLMRPASQRTERDLAGAMASGVVATFYFAFIGYLVVWYADIPEKNVWYVPRVPIEWSWLAVAASGAGFLSLAMMALKRARLAALLCLAGLWLHLVWWIIPSFGWPGALGTVLASAFLGPLYAVLVSGQRRVGSQG
jgi:hypothetical protein